MPTLVIENASLDTNNDFGIGFRDILSLPDFLVQPLSVGVSSQAYMHGPASLNKYDYDTFAVVLETQKNYQIRVSSDVPSMNLNVIKIHSENSHQVGAVPGDGSEAIYRFGTLDEGGQYFIQLGITSYDGQSEDNPYEILMPYEILIREYSYDASIPRAEVEKVALLYEAALDRKPDTPGLNYWVDDLAAGASINDIAESFTNSLEFTTNFNVERNEEFIDQLYLNVLGRVADQAGAEYWLADMEQGNSRSEVLLSFAESNENRSNAADWMSGLDYSMVSDMWFI